MSDLGPRDQQTEGNGRARLTAWILFLLGVGLTGVVFYSMVNSHFLGRLLSQTLGPYTASPCSARW